MIPVLRINTHPPYPVYIGEALLDQAALLACHIPSSARLVIITETTVQALYGEKLAQVLAAHAPLVLAFPAGEAHKTRETKAYLEDQMLAAGINRDSCILALGGGVVSDMAGFVGATYCRGIPVLYAPTSLLAMVDAAVGGKTGVNTASGKNLIGAFHQPSAVFMDVNTLKTLSAAELNNGFVEMLKHAFLESDAAVDAFFAAKKSSHSNDAINSASAAHWLLSDTPRLIELLTASVRIKKSYVETDEHDFGSRQLLNFGHTIGHVIEQRSEYHIPHGHAVAVGMLIESYLSWRQGFLPDLDFEKIKRALGLCGFSLKLPHLENSDAVLQLMQLDKKAQANKINCVLIEGIGKPCRKPVHAISHAAISDALAWYHQEIASGKIS